MDRKAFLLFLLPLFFMFSSCSDETNFCQKVKEKVDKCELDYCEKTEKSLEEAGGKLEISDSCFCTLNPDDYYCNKARLDDKYEFAVSMDKPNYYFESVACLDIMFDEDATEYENSLLFILDVISEYECDENTGELVPPQAATGDDDDNNTDCTGCCCPDDPCEYEDDGYCDCPEMSWDDYDCS